MSFRRTLPVLLGIGIALVSSSAFSADDPSPETRQTLKFLSGLRDRGYHDIAREYIETLRKSPDLPADLKVTLDYQEGRGLLEEATVSNDLVKKNLLLDSARTKLDGFAKANPQHPLASDALMQLARLFIERGHTAFLESKDLKDAEAQGKLTSARAAFTEARKAYDAALVTLKARHEGFPKFIPNDDPRFDQRETALQSLIDGRLQRAVVDYEDAQTYALESKERNELLDKAGADFELLYKDHRSQLAGQTAYALRGKCYEEKGELGPAMGIYNELVAQTIRDVQFDELRRRVAYYRIIVDGKRKEHALAVDEAARWLHDNPRGRTNEYGLGVQLELAKNLLAMLPDLAESERDEATRKATERLGEVVRYFSPYKPEALELLRKYKPKGTLSASQIANLSYDEAMAQADSAMSTHEWDRAITLFNQAVKRADPLKDSVKANKARYFLSYCYFSSGRYYEAAVIAEHLARRYPQREYSDKAADFALAGHTMAYQTYTQIDRSSDLGRLRDFANYTIATWPDSDQSDSARVTLGDIQMGLGQYADAAKSLESVRESSPRKLDAKVKAGDAHWRLAMILREEGKTAEADASQKAAYDLTASALDARKKAGTAPTDPALIINTNALAEILRATGKPKDALALLEPLQKALAAETLSTDVAPLYEGLLTVLLQAHIGDGQSARAIEDMKALEKSSISRDKLTRLYFELSQTLQREMNAQKAKNDMVSYRRTQEAYKKFLKTLAESEAGQTYESLMFAGGGMLALDMPADAEVVFDRMLKKYEKDDEFLKKPTSANAILVLKLKMAEALRKGRKFDPSLELVNKLITQNPRQLEALLEKGYLLEDWARTDRAGGRWNASYNYWKDRAAQLERVRPRRVEYFECVYHMAVALQALDKKADAAKTLRGVMTLSPSVGKPEMKAKYQALLTQLAN